MAKTTCGIALLGCGIVGGGVANILLKQRDVLKQRTGVDLQLRHVVVKSEAEYPPNAAELPMSTDANAAIDDPNVDVVVELIGGTGVAFAFVERALKAGKPIVTANKALLAAKGPELFKLARERNTCIAFEASAGGGIPIIDALQRGLIANRVDALLGIVNGTCNFILSQMTQKGWSYDQALKEAQSQGFAEANPTMDVSGRDSAQKLAILASLAFNVKVEEADIHLEGIDKLDAADLKFADELGYVVKLLAIAGRAKIDGEAAKHQADPISLRVHPTLVHKTDLLAQVSGSFNAISFFGHALGHALFYGRGAGRMPTASAVVSDIIGVALGTTPAQFKHLNVFVDQTPRANVLPFDQLESRYYLRLTAKDQPGVLAAVTKVLGDNKISLASFLQHEVNGGDAVPLVLTTHVAREGAIQAALNQINALPTITAPCVCLRIIDQPKEFAQAQLMRRFTFVLIALFVVTSGCASKPERATVIWISIDGLRPDYVDRADAPLLKKLVREGESTRQLIPPTPSLTFPSHVTQATGVPPGVHGIPGNSFCDTATRQKYSFPNDAAMLQAEPIWITAKRQGVRTLVYDWPLSYAQPGPVRTDYALEKFDTEATDRQRLHRLLDAWQHDSGSEPLRLLMGYIKQPDVVGHKHGPDAPETLAAVAETDRLIQRFVDDATEVFRAKNPRGEQLYIVLTSDHGMAAVHTMVNFDKLFDTPPPRSVQRITGGTFAMLYLDQLPAADREAMTSNMLRDLRRWDFLSVYTRDTLPKQWGLAHPTRVGDIVITLRPGYHLSDRLPQLTFPREKIQAGRGAHGYVPAECPDMNAFCVIWRYPNQMKRRDFGKVRAEQMHPTIARMLNIKPASGVRAKALP